MKKIYEIPLAFIMVLVLAGCTLMLDEIPAEEPVTPTPEDVDLDKVGFDEPFTHVVEGFGTCTFQYGDSTKVFVREMFDYIVDVQQDTIVYLSDNIPNDLLIQPGYYVSHISCLEFPLGLNHKVVDLVHSNGMYEMHMTRVTEKYVFKKYKLNYSADYNLSCFNNSGYIVDEGEDPMKAKIKMAQSNNPANLANEVDWSFAGGMPSPISNKSPYSAKLARETRTVTDYPEESLMLGVEYNKGKSGEVSIKLGEKLSLDAKVPEFNIKNEKLKFFLESLWYSFNIIAKSDIHDVQEKGVYEVGIFRCDYVKDVRTDNSKYHVSLEGGIAASGSNVFSEVVKHLKDSKAKSFLQKLTSRYICKAFVMPVIGVPSVFRFKISPDLTVSVSGKLSFDIDTGTTETTTILIDGKPAEDAEPKTREIEKAKGFTNFKKDASFYMRLSLGIEAFLAAGSGGPLVGYSGAGAGAYIEPWIEYQFLRDDCEKISDDTEAVTENPVCMQSAIDLYAKAGAFVVDKSGNETIYMGGKWHIHSFLKRSWYTSPEFSNIQANINANKDIYSPDYQKLNRVQCKMTMDNLGFDYGYSKAEVQNKKISAGIRIYKYDGFDKKIEGDPLYTLFPGEKQENLWQKDYPYLFATELLDEQVGGKYAAVPFIYYGNTQKYMEFRYATKEFAREEYPELRPICLELLRGQDSEVDHYFEFCFSFKSFNIGADELRNWDDIQVLFEVWKYDIDLGTRKKIGQFRKRLNTVLSNVGTVDTKFNIKGSLAIPKLKNDAEEYRTKYSYELTAKLMHHHKTLQETFLHVVKDGVSKMIVLDDNPDVVDFYEPYTDYATLHKMSWVEPMQNADVTIPMEDKEISVGD